MDEVQEVARATGLQIHVYQHHPDHAIHCQIRIAAHLVATDPFFDTRRDKLIALATHHAVPTMYQFREYAVVQLRACTDPRARDKR